MLNQITLIGEILEDPDLRETRGGTKVVNIVLVTREPVYDRHHPTEKEVWHKVTVWGKNARLIDDNLRAGDAVCVIGKLDYTKWTDKEGVDRTRAEITATRIVLIPNQWTSP